VEGVNNQRVFTINIDEDAVGAAIFTLQRSLVSDSGPWSDIQQWTADVTVTFDDGLANQICLVPGRRQDWRLHLGHRTSSSLS
jgi:hypothetical protein